MKARKPYPYWKNSCQRKQRIIQEAIPIHIGHICLKLEVIIMFKNKIIKTAAVLAIVFSTSPLFAGTFYVKVNVTDESQPYNDDSPDFIPFSQRDSVIDLLFYRTTTENDLLTLFWGKSSGNRVQSISINEDHMKANDLCFAFEKRGCSNAAYLLQVSGEPLETIPLEKDGKQLRSLKLTLKGKTGQISDLDYGEGFRTW